MRLNYSITTPGIWVLILLMTVLWTGCEKGNALFDGDPFEKLFENLEENPEDNEKDVAPERDPLLVGKWEYFWYYSGISQQTQRTIIEFLGNGQFKEIVSQTFYSYMDGSYHHNYEFVGTWSSYKGLITRKSRLVRRWGSEKYDRGEYDEVCDEPELEIVDNYELKENNSVLILPAIKVIYHGSIRTFDQANSFERVDE